MAIYLAGNHAWIYSVRVGSLISEHFAIHCALQTSKPPVPKSLLTYWKFKNINQKAFDADILSSSLHTDPASFSMDEMVEQYNRVLWEMVDRHAPAQTRLMNGKPRHVPRISDDIKAAQTERRRLERRWRSSKLTLHRQMFTHQRDVVSAMCKEAKREYYQRRITDCGSDQRKLYRLMDDLLQRMQRSLLAASSRLQQGSCRLLLCLLHQ